MSFAGIIRESLNGLNGAARSVLLTVLIECNHSDNPNFILDNKIFPLERGQWISSNQRISELTGLSRQQVRTGIKVNQQLTSMSTSKATSRATLYVIENPNKFLVKQKEQPAQQPAETHAANQQLTTNNKEQIKNNKDKINILTSFEKEFDVFWKAYPTHERPKGSKKKAGDKFVTARKSASFEEIIGGLQAYAQHIEKTQERNADAFRWLNDRRWKDEYVRELTKGEDLARLKRMQDELNNKTITGVKPCLLSN